MPGEYTESVFSGQAVAGVISRLEYRSNYLQLNHIFSIINIISIAVTKNQEQAAVCFFFLAAGITVLVMISFHRLRQNEYFKQCQRQPFEMEVCSIRCSIWSGYTRLVKFIFRMMMFTNESQ